MKEFKIPSLVFYLLIAAELILFCVGAISPLFIIKESLGWWVFNENNTSLLGIVETFYLEKELDVIFDHSDFGIISPVIKVFAKAIGNISLTNLLHKFTHIDILLVVILIYISKSSYYLDVILGSGFYILTASVILGYLTGQMSYKKRVKLIFLCVMCLLDKQNQNHFS